MGVRLKYFFPSMCVLDLVWICETGILQAAILRNISDYHISDRGMAAEVDLW